MCRMVAFAGYCTVCAEFFSWEELSQELSCLEAKNNGVFGDCRKGIQVEEHEFDQECDACAETNAADEGVEVDTEESYPDHQPVENKKGRKTSPEHPHGAERNRKRQRLS
ncbi:hypothetical protein MKZ38_001541 [Zalerion maritima]|uniref:Uncharacterized protein n=1 Tax=Zalerion maritima TaxID=339359 RepID=A0AAD5RFC7_9PEZI|nr:hypothetical protein MKZ38_001541 [Zalerion maritima]